MRLIPFLLPGIVCLAVGAQQTAPPTIASLEGSGVAPSPAELHDAWDGISQLTNGWAVSIRQRPEWTNVVNASVAETKTLVQQGLAAAQLKLGYLYFSGAGMDRDYTAAFQWLESASKAQLAPAEFLLGIAYLNGLGVPRNFESAVDQLNSAAEQGFADAEFQLGVCYLKGGPGVNQAPARGVKWLIRAAEQGKPGAQQFLAWCFASGTGAREDPPQAFQWCSKAAAQGLDSAQDFLGMFWASGYGTNQDWGQAVSWFRRAADQGLGTAQIHLAQCYGNGRGVIKDPILALHWWLVAADQGYPTAQFHAGLCQYQGLGTPRDLSAAVESFRKAAESQHIGAQLYLGLCFWKGLGVTTDPELAQKWWRDAAVKGIAHQLPELGEDPADVEKWWQQVAEQADPRLQCCLAEFYRFGHGVPQSDLKALKWYRKASATGDVPALRAAAWLMATSPKSEVRDGRAAIEFARKVASASKRKDPKALDTLAAAYAETAQFSKAINTESEAIALAQEDDEKKEYQSRLKLYQTGTPFRYLPDLQPLPQME